MIMIVIANELFYGKLEKIVKAKFEVTTTDRQCHIQPFLFAALEIN